MENPVPLALAAEMVTVDPPVLVSVWERFALLLTWTLPKARLVGFAVNVPGATPVPERGMLKLGFDPLDVMLTLPLAAPADVGANFTANEVLWPAVNVTGKVSPLKLNPVPLAEAAEMVRLDPPVLVSVTDRLVLLPS
jgi:hypothetical protein